MGHSPSAMSRSRWRRMSELTLLEAPALPIEVARSLPTPCLLVDLAACERNVERAATYFANTRAKLRPHYKAHKCSELLGRQVRAGSCTGVTCATAAEAERLALRGFDDILVANQVVTHPGLAALGRAATASRITVAVDHLDHLDPLQRQAESADVTFDLLIEIDVGMDRCGLESESEQLLPLAGAIRDRDRLTLRGLQGYEGHAVLRPTREERRALVTRAGEILAHERDRLQANGHACSLISGGGTGTFDLASEAGVLDEVQAGSYALMDARYGTLDLPFENALFMVTTVISQRRPGVATVNAGLKSLTVEYGMAKAVDPAVEVLKLADEHAWLSLADVASLSIGEQVFLIPAHIDPAINLHDALFVWDAGSESLEPWPVDGRRIEAKEALA
jgi:D-serine deaminase-like pyridoxal phosphate-dependent protein